MSRRTFLKVSGLTGVGAIVAPFNQSVKAIEEGQTMPTRLFGKSGIKVPILSFGGSLNTSMSPLLLRQAAKWGVTYWDTANSYMGGKSEKGIGKYFAKFPEDRKKIFLVGLTAMKTQGGGQVKTNTETEFELAGRFIKKGYTDAQAKLKAVWDNPNIASICSEMPNMTILMANVAAAMNKTKLSSWDMNLLQRYAKETHSDYCAGCTKICESTVNGQVPIGDVMRCLMYFRSYSERNHAIALFKDIPEKVRAKITSLDYSLAEKRCPQKMAIGNLMRDAIEELS